LEKINTKNCRHLIVAVLEKFLHGRNTLPWWHLYDQYVAMVPFVRPMRNVAGH
jgi:hypothetical protein